MGRSFLQGAYCLGGLGGEEGWHVPMCACVQCLSCVWTGLLCTYTITAWVSDREDTPVGFSLSHKLTQCQPFLDSGFWQSHPKTSLFPGLASPVTSSRVTALIVPLLCLMSCNSFHSQRNRFTGTPKAKGPHCPLLISGDLIRAPSHLDSSCWSKPQGSS